MTFHQVLAYGIIPKSAFYRPSYLPCPQWSYCAVSVPHGEGEHRSAWEVLLDSSKELRDYVSGKSDSDASVTEGVVEKNCQEKSVDGGVSGEEP